jgi:hypothetical protein
VAGLAGVDDDVSPGLFTVGLARYLSAIVCTARQRESGSAFGPDYSARRTQIRLSKTFTCVVVARKDGMARTAYSNSDSEDDPKEVTAIGKIPASTRGDGVPSFASFAGFRGSRCPGF